MSYESDEGWEVDARPLDSLDQLWDWKLHALATPGSDSVVSLKSNYSRRDGPEILICHDMKGGYLDEER